MSGFALFLKALGTRIARPGRRLQNRVRASRSRLGTKPKVVETLPEPLLFGESDAGMAMVEGRWNAFGHEIEIGSGTIWEPRLPDERLEPERQSCIWLDDLAALGNKAARSRAQAWVQDWIRRYGSGSGPGWTPDLAGRRAKRWTAHCILLTKNLDQADADRFWKALASQQKYLMRSWKRAKPGLPRLQALTGLVWTGVVLPHAGHAKAVEELGRLADQTINSKGEVASRSPQDLADTMVMLIWAARILENSGQHAVPEHLSAIVRGVPVLRPLRMGGGNLAMFHGGGAGEPDRLDQALAELRVGVQAKPDLAMGFSRLSGGRIAVVMDAAKPPVEGPHSLRAHASTLAFEMSVHRLPLVVSGGPGHVFGADWNVKSRLTGSHSTVELAGASSSTVKYKGLAARTFGPRLVDPPGRVVIRQAQDATGQWLLATQNGYEPQFGVVHERRLFVDARGGEVRGEDLLSVPEKHGQAKFNRATKKRPLRFALRFHIHPDVQVVHELNRNVVLMRLPTDEIWVFRASDEQISVEESNFYDPRQARPVPSMQVVVHGEMVEYLGQIIWSIGRYSESQGLSEEAF
ncbi:heparinase II/III family protein [Amaricoccus tamworthensis]|uniref:heparinase II/III family protein n=1 Tax=Amaricoccus tamworthensis TaxID=57002 RepID=UPI003C7E60CC